GVAVDHLDPLQVHVELVRGDLREGRADALTQLDLPGEDRHRAARIDAKPRVQHPVRVEAARELSRTVLRQGPMRGERESDNEPARLEEVTAGKGQPRAPHRAPRPERPAARTRSPARRT